MDRHKITLGGAVVLASFMAACGTGDGSGEMADTGATDTAQAQTADDGMNGSFTATLLPMNESVAGSTPSGGAQVQVQGDSVVFQVTAAGLPPEIMALQHLHGFADGSPARCPGGDADANGDGLVDLMETEALAGVTMIPFHADPASLEIQAETYPSTDADGAYTYRQVVSLAGLQSALESRFGSGDLAVGNRVIFIHGVPSDTDLPESVQSLDDVPAHVTLPVACGEFGPSAGS